MVLAPDATNDTPVLPTARVEISFGTDEDAEQLFPFVHGEAGRAVTDTLVWDGPDTVEDLAGFLRMHATGTWRAHGCHWVLRDRDGSLTGTEQRAVGSIGLTRGATDEECDIGYWLAPPLWGRGLMAEAIVAVVGHAFGLGFSAVTADVFAFNERGCRVLERVGFERTELLPDAIVKRGRPIDVVRFRVTADALAAAS